MGIVLGGLILDVELAKQRVHAIPELLGDGAGFLARANHVRRDQDDELGAPLLVARGPEQLAENGDVHQVRHAAARLGLRLLDDAADDDRLAALDDDGGFGLTGREGWRVVLGAGAPALPRP